MRTISVGMRTISARATPNWEGDGGHRRAGDQIAAESRTVPIQQVGEAGDESGTPTSNCPVTHWALKELTIDAGLIFGYMF